MRSRGVNLSSELEQKELHEAVQQDPVPLCSHP